MRRKASLPVRGAWIEISIISESTASLASLPVRGAWIEIISKFLYNVRKRSLPVRGAWIEMLKRWEYWEEQAESLPVRGAWIEIDSTSSAVSGFASLPVRGAWIEMLRLAFFVCNTGCRSPCGERGLKYHQRPLTLFLPCRSPCGERGLKSCERSRRESGRRSLPVRGAWIEIGLTDHMAFGVNRRSPCGERGLKSGLSCAGSGCVAPRAGSVD